MLRISASLGSGYRWREGVGSCTESLGSESGDVVVVGCDAEIIEQQQAPGLEVESRAGRVVGTRGSPEKRRRMERSFPPAMPRAAEAFMRAERRGGRLILTEVVRAERREVFRASRTDGRLQLRFAEPPDGAEAAVPAEHDAPAESAASGGGLVVSGCCNGGGFCQVAAPGAGRCLEIGAVMGI
ncbi:hypothetical protein GUJ93_ZPchr0011g27195 [Zizania palustris]|uniref:FAF domain-containing protein n=1 Tax=Zizania palustris TaxID=103762 RepID=A0A8J6BQV8_ZIZPA|nr:hypothetical protein GUJ93_ZPchr0011g27195 [Zizania palustris]